MSGRVLSGQVAANQTVTVLDTDGAVVEVARLTKLLRGARAGTDSRWMAAGPARS